MNPVRLIIPVVILVIAVGAIVFRDRLSSNAGELVAGDCFEVPTAETVKDVQHRPCTDPHNGEVLLVGKFEGSDTLPSDAQYEAWVRKSCVDSTFAEYVGQSYESSQDIDVGWFTPTKEGWDGGDRQMICYLTPVSGANVTTSFRAAVASPAP